MVKIIFNPKKPFGIGHSVRVAGPLHDKERHWGPSHHPSQEQGNRRALELANNSQRYLDAVGFQGAISGDVELMHGQ